MRNVDPNVHKTLEDAVVAIVDEGFNATTVKTFEDAVGSTGYLVYNPSEQQVLVLETIGRERSYYAMVSRGNTPQPNARFGNRGGIVTWARSLIPQPDYVIRNLLTGREALPGSDWEQLHNDKPHVYLFVAWGLVAGYIYPSVDEDTLMAVCLDNNPEGSRVKTGGSFNTFGKAWEGFQSAGAQEEEMLKAKLYIRTGKPEYLPVPFAGSPVANPQPAAGRDYNIGQIRQLLLAAFSAETLARLLEDTLYSSLKPLRHSFGRSDGLAAMVDKVIAHCTAEYCMNDLLLEIARVNQRQYSRFEQYLFL